MNVPDRETQRGKRPYDLSRCQQVSVCDLTGAERFVVWAIRWRCSAQDDEEFASTCLEDSFERAGLRGLQQSLERYVCATCPQRLACPAAQRLGCWRLNALEAHSLHAIGCLQAGLIGEAWMTLRTVCPDARLQEALESLQEMGQAIARVGGHINQWHRDGSDAGRVSVH
jgi:hypothetical protein